MKMKHPRNRVRVKGKDKILVLENCGSSCGLFDGYLCRDCTGLGRIVEIEKAKQEGGDA